MLRSMYSGISGLKNFQMKLDVIGNNIANVNTYGFKKGRVVFKDMMSQTISGASASTENRGGVNSKQIGYGSQTATIDTIQDASSSQTTNRVLDVAISGDGFFQVGSATTNNSGAHTGFSDVQYTRSGNFYMDNDGYLVNGDGLFVVGFTAVNDNVTPEDINLNISVNSNGTPSSGDSDATYKPIQIPTDAQSMSIGKDGTVTYIDAGGELKWAGKLILAKFPNSSGLERLGNNMFQKSNNSGNPNLGFAGQAGIGTTESGFLEMSNVDLSEEFTEMIVAQRGFQANTRIITTSDEILQELVNLKR